MSLESAKAFHEKLLSDGNFRSAFLVSMNDEQRMEAVRKAGYGFTKDEYLKASKMAVQDELSDEALEHIAGGMGCGDCYTMFCAQQI